MQNVEFSLETVVAIGSAAIALISLWLNHSVIRRQLALQREEVRAAVDHEKTRWLGATLETFAEAEALALAGAQRDLEPQRLLITQRLSTLADQGRLSFPNLDPKNRGQENPAAYQGVRQPALDAVILAHDLIRDLPEILSGGAGRSGRDVQSLLFACRRVLVSEVQKSVDPRRRAEVLRAGKRSGAAAKASRGEIAAIMAAMKELEMKKISLDA